MNIVLWIIQVLLALLFLFAGGMKLILPIDVLTSMGPPNQVQLPGLFIRFIGVCEVLGALGLILPGLFRIKTRLTTLAAAGLMIIMIGAVAVSLKLGIGAALMKHALAAAKARGHGAVLLLGDAPYYARFGFSGLKTTELSLPGPFERDRLLGLELRDGALDGAWGMIAPTGASASPTKARRTKLLRSVPQAA